MQAFADRTPIELTLEEIALVIADRDAAILTLTNVTQQLTQAQAKAQSMRSELRLLEANHTTESNAAFAALKREFAKEKYLWGAEREELQAGRDDAEQTALDMQGQVRVLRCRRRLID